MISAQEAAKLPYRPCVGVMLVNRSGGVFVGQRLDNPGPAWQMPQGGIDPGEEPRDAALRELLEETGVGQAKVEIVTQTKGWVDYDLPLDFIPKLWKGRFRGQRQKWFLMRFKGLDEDVRIETEVPEFSQWRWLPANELVANIVPFKREVYSQVLDEFLPHIR